METKTRISYLLDNWPYLLIAGLSRYNETEVDEVYASYKKDPLIEDQIALRNRGKLFNLGCVQKVAIANWDNMLHEISYKLDDDATTAVVLMKSPFINSFTFSKVVSYSDGIKMFHELISIHNKNDKTSIPLKLITFREYKESVS